ncbi:hypothetical protein [Microbispora sp. CA-102843]|uniref:hypothetical protein n=1 Tax=Microbispora sp. CA-102843 TaxID=3239952 RepID=UPI003D8DA062
MLPPLFQIAYGLGGLVAEGDAALGESTRAARPSTIGVANALGRAGKPVARPQGPT